MFGSGTTLTWWGTAHALPTHWFLNDNHLVWPFHHIIIGFKSTWRAGTCFLSLQFSPGPHHASLCISLPQLLINSLYTHTPKKSVFLLNPRSSSSVVIFSLLWFSWVGVTFSNIFPSLVIFDYILDIVITYWKERILLQYSKMLLALNQLASKYSHFTLPTFCCRGQQLKCLPVLSTHLVN
jgi:hypothetical protein